MKLKKSYHDYGKFILRTPLFPLNFFFELTKTKIVEDSKLKLLFESNLVLKEAIYHASPSLYYEILKWCNDELIDKKKVSNVKQSFFKYLVRMSSRCTPFGFFASVSTGIFGDNNNVVIHGFHNHKKRLRLSYRVTSELCKLLLKDSNIRQNVLFFPNTTLYYLNDQIRYIETIHNATSRDHKIVSIRKTPLLVELLKLSKKGIKLRELSEIICKNSDEIDIETANSFINQLVDSQILVSEFESNKIGDQYFERVLEILKRINCNNEKLSLLFNKISLLEKSLGTNPEEYVQLKNYLPEILKNKFKKNILLADLYTSTEVNALDSKMLSDISKGFDFVNKLSVNNKYRRPFTEFIKAFSDRYGERKVALAKVMDTEMGIGFIQDGKQPGLAPFIEDIDIPINFRQSFVEEKLSRGELLLIQKHGNLNPGEILRFRDADLEENDKTWVDYELDWNKSHDSIAAIVEIIQENGETKYVLGGIQGPSGASWISRFCYGSNNIDAFVKSITQFEESMYEDDIILAEVSYSPKKEAEGVIVKTDIRTYEIPYLTHSLKEDKYKIHIRDLYLYLEKGELKLWSKKHNKRVIPRVTDAHYFDYGSLPFYHFMYELQFQGKKLLSSFFWSKAMNHLSYLPRVEYRNMILGLETWKIKTKDIQSIIKEKDDSKFFEKVTAWKKLRNLPDVVKLRESDQELLVNMKNITSVRSLFSSIKNSYEFALTEFLSNQKGFIKNADGEYFANELIIPFKRKIKK